jgi:hypothetical protein
MSTLRRYAPLAPSAGTRIPHAMRLHVLTRDAAATGGCVGYGRFPTTCAGPLSLDHVRASGAIGKKSTTCPCNLVSLCNNGCHRWKTENGREARPLLLTYLEQFGYGPHTEGHVESSPDCGHVDPRWDCAACQGRSVA